MVTVKFIVFLFLIVSCECYSKYCKICSNHVLCKFSTPGPGVTCKEYDRNTFLRDDDIYDLVNQINERRNFIALGHSRHLPSAANMNKLVWSEELATSAQRWVDQCDPSLRPDKEDQCRDLEHTNVGQNIASIINPSPKFKVKSFIEMWFIHLLDYKGSVTYYDKFQDHISNYFTQLIWAETENVGCGRAKFKINNVTVDRIVCNFSPKGNVQGKSIYTIGYPRAQCQNEALDLGKFKGLCAPTIAPKAKFPTENLPVSSLLKILNLSNDSVKQEIDPIYNNMKQIIQHRNEMESPKHQMRHIFGNTLQTKGTESQTRNYWEGPINVSRNYKEHFHHREKEYSRVTHSHVHRQNYQPRISNQMGDFRKYVKSTDSDNSYGNFNNIKKKCTRSSAVTHNKDCENNSKTQLNQNFHQCTRGQKTNWQMLQNTNIPVTNTIPHELCPYSTNAFTVFPSTNTQQKYSLNCECVNLQGLTIRCPNLIRTLVDNAYNRNVALESEFSIKDQYPNPENEYELMFNKRRKNIPRSKRSRYVESHRNRFKREFDYSSTFKPFWQIESFSGDGKHQLKALRYTTLSKKRQQRTKKYPPKAFTTESITIKLKNTRFRPVTEKYLSFDELLHLRKFNLSGNLARRKMEHEVLRNSTEASTTVVTEATTPSVDENSNYTAHTPFIRMKHCTRKLTCTWTAASLTDSNGSVVGDHDRGSRTPPGYVEGCTRTSTCTRDYMNKNKFPTTITSSTSDGGDGGDDDDANNNSDYCERRSLNFQKRNIHKKRSFSEKYLMGEEHLKKKRSLTGNKYTQSNLSYGDLYYLVLSKIVKQWETKRNNHRRCPCNRASETPSYLHIVLLLSNLYLCYFNYKILVLCL